MNKLKVAQLLTVISGFDNRKVSDVAIEAWFMVPAIRDADFEIAKRAVIAHVAGPDASEYIEARHIIAYVMVESRQTSGLIAEDVRSARARGLVGPGWSESTPVSLEVQSKLTMARESARDHARKNIYELEGGSWEL